MVSALRQIGFDYVFDTDFTADLTIMEEGSEFIERFTHASEHNVAHVHLLLPRLGPLCQDPIPAVCGLPVHSEIAPADVRRGG